jgi:protein SCO1/2
MNEALRNPFLWAFVVGCVLVTMMRPMLRYEPGPPTVIGHLPAFSLVAAHGQAFGSDDLRGHVYVANFFFTRCRSTCPAVMNSMAALQQRYRESALDVRLVSISVDPAFDEPERLREAEAQYGVDPSRWTLLTGRPEAVRDLVEKGFEVAMGKPAGVSGGAIDIAHSGKLVLVDARGNLRGYYGTDELGLDEVFHRSRHVLREAAG